MIYALQGIYKFKMLKLKLDNADLIKVWLIKITREI